MLLRRDPVQTGIGRRVFEYPEHGTTAQVESKSRGVGFKPPQKAQALGIAFKTSVKVHHAVQRSFSPMAEGRMSEVMCESQGFDRLQAGQKRLVIGKSFSQLKHQSPADLGDLHRMGQTCPVKISFENTEDLGFGLKPSECSGMYYSRPVAFVGSSRIS